MGENTGPSNNSKLKSKHTMYGKKGLLTKKNISCVCLEFIFITATKKIFFCGFPLSMCINVRNALNIKHFKRLFLMSPKYS